MSFRTFIQHNFWLKLFSLLLATLIWFAIYFWIHGGLRVHESPIDQRVLHLPIRILSKPGDIRTFKVEPTTVAVTVVGEEAVLRDLRLQDVSAFADLTKVRSSHETNQRVKLDLPSGVTSIRVEPRTVNVEEVSH